MLINVTMQCRTDGCPTQAWQTHGQAMTLGEHSAYHGQPLMTTAPRGTLGQACGPAGARLREQGRRSQRRKPRLGLQNLNHLKSTVQPRRRTTGEVEAEPENQESNECRWPTTRHNLRCHSEGIGSTAYGRTATRTRIHDPLDYTAHRVSRTTDSRTT